MSKNDQEPIAIHTGSGAHLVHVQLLQLLQVRIHRRRSSRTSAFTLRLSSCGAVATVFPSAPTIPPRSAACGRGALPAGGGARTLRNVKDTRRDGRGTTCYEGKCAQAYRASPAMTSSDRRGSSSARRSPSRRNSITVPPARESDRMGPANAECVSICADRPTPAGYSFTVTCGGAAAQKSRKGLAPSRRDDSLTMLPGQNVTWSRPPGMRSSSCSSLLVTACKTQIHGKAYSVALAPVAAGWCRLPVRAWMVRGQKRG